MFFEMAATDETLDKTFKHGRSPAAFPTLQDPHTVDGRNVASGFIWICVVSYGLIRFT